MTWHDIPVEGGDGITCTATRSQVALTIPHAVLRRAGWDLDVALQPRAGMGEHAGWVRLVKLDLGLPHEQVEAGIRLTLPTSVLRGVGTCRDALLMSRFVTDDDVVDAIDVQLPVAKVRPVKPVAATPAIAAVGADQSGAQQPNAPAIVVSREPAAPSAVAPHPVPAPEKWQMYRKELAAKGVNLDFYSNGKILLNGTEVQESQIKRRAARAASAMDEADGEEIG